MIQSVLWNPSQGKPRYQCRPRLNPAHPLNCGIKYFALLNEGGSKFYDLVSGASIDLANGATVDPIGGIRCDANAERAYGLAPSDLTATYPCSLVVRCYILGAPSYFASHISNRNKIAILGGASTPLRYSHGGYSGTTWTQWASSISYEIGFRTIVSVIDNGYQRLYVDGFLIHSTSSAMSQPTSPDGNIYLGQDSSSATRNSNSIILLAAAYNRILTDSEAMEWYLHPYGSISNPRLFVEPKNTLWASSGGEPPVPTLPLKHPFLRPFSGPFGRF